MSLNFRPNHNDASLRSEARFRWNQLMVILGYRPSISSQLRHCLLGSPGSALKRKRSESPGFFTAWLTTKKPRAAEDKGPAPASRFEETAMEDMLPELGACPSTAAYLIFCTPQRVYVMEKDHRTARLSTNSDYLTKCNHDTAHDEDDAYQRHLQELETSPTDNSQTGMDLIVMYSLNRQQRAAEIHRTLQRELGGSQTLEGQTGAISLDDVLRLVGDKEITNEETHYGVVMDPQEGRILWRRAYRQGELP
jgi:hypothetical protein